VSPTAEPNVWHNNAPIGGALASEATRIEDAHLRGSMRRTARSCRFFGSKLLVYLARGDAFSPRNPIIVALSKLSVFLLMAPHRFPFETCKHAGLLSAPAGSRPDTGPGPSSIHGVVVLAVCRRHPRPPRAPAWPSACPSRCACLRAPPGVSHACHTHARTKHATARG
jgi:hypothetical protein